MTDFQMDLNWEKMNRAHVQTLTLPTNPYLFSMAFNYMSMMHARPNRPPKKNNCQLFWAYGVSTGGMTPFTSLPICISSRVLTVLNLRNRGQCTCRKLTDIFIEPFMPAHMKASPYITAHYRSGIHASNTAWTALIRYRGDVFTVSFYSQYNRPMVGILAAAQVGHFLSTAFGSHHRREGQTPSAD